MKITTEENNGYQVIVVNTKYGRILNEKIKDRPEMSILDIPEGILKTKNKHNVFEDNIESFVYNTLTKKYGAEVSHCQIYLPF